MMVSLSVSMNVESWCNGQCVCGDSSSCQSWCDIIVAAMILYINAV